MATKLSALAFRLFGPQAVRTSTQPNSRAAVALWNRWFQMQAEEEEEKVEHLEEVFSEYGGHPPAEELRQVREDFVREQRLELTGRLSRPSLTIEPEPAAVAAPPPAATVSHMPEVQPDWMRLPQ